MHDKAVENYLHISYFVSEYYNTQKMFDKAVDIYPSAMNFDPGCLMTQEICDEAVNSNFFSIQFYSWSV